MISRPLKSLVRKRTITIGHHETSVTLEPPFWDGLREIANERGLMVSALIEKIKADLGNGNLSSAIRLFVLRYYQDQISALNQRA
jgi:predicted DNA-binding ribbon-helix-helix protein